MMKRGDSWRATAAGASAEVKEARILLRERKRNKTDMTMVRTQF